MLVHPCTLDSARPRGPVLKITVSAQGNVPKPSEFVLTGIFSQAASYKHFLKTCKRNCN